MNVLHMSVPLAYIERKTDSAEPIFFDIETNGLYTNVVLAQFKQEAWNEVLEIEYPNYADLQAFLKDKHIVSFPTSYDLGTMNVSPRKIDDLYFASKSVYPHLEKHSLDQVAPEVFFGVAKKEMQKSFLQSRQAFTEEQLHYGALDVIALEQIWQRPEIQRFITNNLSYKVDVKNQKYALGFQHNGMPVIHSKWMTAVDATATNRDTWQGKLNDIVGRDLNVKSLKQKQEVFPELPKVLDKKTGKTKQPTDAKAFKKLYIETDKEVYKLVLDTTKARTNLQDLEKYRESYIPDEHPVRIRTFFNVAGAITGRYASKGGDRVGYTNIQNIGRHFKHIFGYEEGSGRKIISADYSTAELIAGCEIMKIDSMRDLIMDGIDLHRAMAANLTKKDISEITKDERQGAKAVNFGYLFGLGIEKFQEYAYDTYGVKLTMEDAREYKRIYYEAHPEIEAYHSYMGRAVKKHHFTVKTALGRVVAPDRYADALNIPVQGTIGETTKMGINFLMEDYPTLMAEGMIINMVHDSIILDFPDEYADEAGEAVSASMKLAWREISKSSLFNYHDLPMGVEVDIAQHFK